MVIFVLRSLESFIHSGYLYSAPSRNLLRGALSPECSKYDRFLASQIAIVDGVSQTCYPNTPISKVLNQYEHFLYESAITK